MNTNAWVTRLFITSSLTPAIPVTIICYGGQSKIINIAMCILCVFLCVLRAFVVK